MKMPKAFECLLPPWMRREPPLSNADHTARFARIANDDPSFHAIKEYGREIARNYFLAAFLKRRQGLKDDAMAEMERGFTISNFLDAIEDERANAAKFTEQQQQRR